MSLKSLRHWVIKTYKKVRIAKFAALFAIILGNF